MVDVEAKSIGEPSTAPFAVVSRVFRLAVPLFLVSRLTPPMVVFRSLRALLELARGNEAISKGALKRYIIARCWRGPLWSSSALSLLWPPAPLLKMVGPHQPNNRSAWSLRRWTNFTLYVITTVRVAAVTFFFFDGIIHQNRYTYWNYTLQTMFYLGLSISQMFRLISLEYWLTVYALPVVYGSVVEVAIFIIIILQLDGGWLMFTATQAGGGPYTLGTIHSADAFVHFFPVFDLFALFISGYLSMARCTIRTHLHHLYQKCIWDQPSLRPLLYRIFVYISFCIPLTPYAIFFNPFEEYPIPRRYSHSSLLLLAASIGFFVMAWFYEVVTRSFCPLTITEIPCKRCWYSLSQCSCSSSTPLPPSSAHCCGDRFDLPKEQKRKKKKTQQ